MNLTRMVFVSAQNNQEVIGSNLACLQYRTEPSLTKEEEQNDSLKAKPHRT